MNITVEQLVNFGRFPYSKGRMKKEDYEQVEYALDLLTPEHSSSKYKNVIWWSKTTCLYCNDNCSRYRLYIIR